MIMRIRFNTLLCRFFMVSTAVLLGLCIYHLYHCPLKSPTPLVLSPSLVLQNDFVLTVGELQENDRVLILKREFGVVLKKHDLGYFTVSYMDNKGLIRTGTFPYTVLQKVVIQP